jgi:hypothetical protein
VAEFQSNLLPSKHIQQRLSAYQISTVFVAVVTICSSIWH